MKNIDKSEEKYRANCTVSDKIGEWIVKEAREMGVTPTAYVRMLIFSAYKNRKKTGA